MDTIDLGAGDAPAVDANPDDEWGFSTGKKKKGKKGKAVEPDPLPPPEPEPTMDTIDFGAGDAPAADANPDDEWGFSTGKKKKGKKGKVRGLFLLSVCLHWDLSFALSETGWPRTSLPSVIVALHVSCWVALLVRSMSSGVGGCSVH